MKRVLLIFLASGLAPLLAQERLKPASVDTATAFAIANPDENSPFFLSPGVSPATYQIEYAGSDPKDEIAEYPQNRNSEGSAATQIKKFFGGMFSSVNLGPIRTPPTTENLQVDPSSFSLQDRREVNVTYSIRNNTKKLSRLEYPTTQRIDILTYDSKGIVVDRWSDDRAFQPEEGIVIINPKERIEYQEKIPTREMKAGETYRIETFTTGSEKFQSTKPITPQ
ncbi:MAG: hypothetical protein IAE94_09300 [Chthoniobacterales bacterium]|nr:hypothetical protein [Chthoniobacterales bacterium]